MYYSFALIFLFFIIYAIIGWLCEEVYCSILEGHIVNRGFLNGPYCPIYGVGALIIIYVLAPYADSPLNVFVLGVFLTSLLEYLTSWGMEKLFHAKWWDYSDHRFNINGRVCLLNSTMFGALCLILMYLVHPLVINLLDLFSETQLMIIALIISFFFLLDLVESVREIVALNKKLDAIYESTREFAENFKEKGLATASQMSKQLIDFADGKLEDASDSLEDVRNQAQVSFSSFLSKIREKHLLDRYTNKRLVNAFPDMIHHRRQNSLNLYKSLIHKKESTKKNEVIK
ncbi:putative ABC transporter permease [Eubacteriaceae bacterium ES2]|nr:putative ABC transporter permease [Eubacteriaceae bacterium ES2]